MLHAIIGKKIKQTQMYTSEGVRIPVTQVLAGPCTITQIKTVDTDGYWAVQLGFDLSPKKVTKAQAGHFKKTGQGNIRPRFLQEVRFAKEDELTEKVGDQVNVDQVLKVGDKIKVSGISKSKGFQGGVKRHGFSGGPRTHGQSDRERAPGSIGQTTTPGRVYKGKRMAGRMGGELVSIQGLKVVAIDPTSQVVTVKGLIPGNRNRYVVITKQ